MFRPPPHAVNTVYREQANDNTKLHHAAGLHGEVWRWRLGIGSWPVTRLFQDQLDPVLPITVVRYYVYVFCQLS
jgi:hypothetical protein